MKSNNRFKVVLFLAILISLEGCQSSPEREYNILNLEGTEWAVNFSNSDFSFGSTSFSEEHPEVKLVVSPGDLVIAMAGYYRYMKGDSLILQVSDEMEGACNGKQVNLLISDDESLSEIEKMSPEDISHLQLLLIENPLTEEQLNILEKYRDYFLNIGMMLEDDIPTKQFNRLLSILEPTWLITDSLIINESASENLKNLELLILTDGSWFKSDSLKYCPNLQQLIISEWSPGKGEFLNLSSMKNLNSLIFENCELAELSHSDFPPSLNRLHFIYCEPPADISMLKDIAKLKSFSLANCAGTIDSAFSARLPNLQYLALPAEISQEDFNRVIKKQLSLEVLEIHGSDSITDLSILKDLPKLKALTIGHEGIDLSQLHDLQNPELIILNMDQYFDDSIQIEQLKAALPETDIYPGGGFCLGSGWLLLMIPFIIFTRYSIGAAHKLRNRRNG